MNISGPEKLKDKTNLRTWDEDFYKDSIAPGTPNPHNKFIMLLSGPWLERGEASQGLGLGLKLSDLFIAKP